MVLVGIIFKARKVYEQIWVLGILDVKELRYHFVVEYVKSMKTLYNTLIFVRRRYLFTIMIMPLILTRQAASYKNF